MKPLLVCVGLSGVIAVHLAGAPLNRAFAADSKAASDNRYHKLAPPVIPAAVALKGGESAGQVRAAYAQAVAALLPGLGTNDAEGFLTLEATVHHAARPGAEEERVACATALAGSLGANVTVEAKVALLAHLTTIGRAEAVGPAAVLLDSPDLRLRETARRTLQQNPAPEAGAALREALGKAVDPAWQTALALALGARGEAAGVGAISRLLTSKDAGVVGAALDALAAIGGTEAVKTVGGVLRGGGPAAVAAEGAYLKLADRAREEGRAAEAEAMFKKLGAAAKSPAMRFSALNGELAAAGDAAAPRIVGLLGADDPAGRAVALGRVHGLGAAGRRALLDYLDRLAPAAQAAVVESLAGVGEMSVLPLAIRWTGSADPALRVAGLASVARLGDASSVTPMVEALVKATDARGRAQVEPVLVALAGGAATDEALRKAFMTATGDVRRSLIGVWAKRGGPTAVATLMQETDSADSACARDAFRALASVAGSEEAPVLLAKLGSLRRPELRGEAENAARRALARIEKPAQRSATLFAALGEATAPEVRQAFLRMLPEVADRKSAETVRRALKDADARIRESAVRAFAQWPHAEAWNDLMDVYREPEQEKLRSLALNGLVRIAQAGNAKPDAALIDRYRQLLAGAKSDADRKLILGALGGVASAEALEIVKPLLSDPAVKAEADLAAKAILAAIRKRDPEAAREAVRRFRQSQR